MSSKKSTKQVEAPKWPVENNEESNEDEKEKVWDVAKRDLLEAFKIAAVENDKPYRGIEDGGESMKRLEALSEMWNTAGKTVEEEGWTMSGTANLSGLWEDKQEFREGYTAVSDVAVNLVDYLCMNDAFMFDFEKDTCVITQAVQVMMGRWAVMFGVCFSFEWAHLVLCCFVFSRCY